MIQEYLPILKREENGIRVIGKRERELCHGKNPVFHGTAVIAAVLPDGRLLLADKTEKQQKKRRREGREPLEEGIRIYDIFGGHMQYEHIPEPERTSFVSLATYQACALRELSEELLRKTQDGHFSRFHPDTERIKALGFYELSNDHNREYSWAFVYFLPDMGPYASQDTFLHDGAEEIIDLPVQAFTWKELLQIFHGNSGEKRLSDGIGRILLHEEGDKLHKIIPVRTEYEMDCDQKCEMAYQKMKTLMTQPEPPTAIFTSNNMMTLGCLRYLTEHNLQIGKDIALIGFDDIEILQMIDYKLSVVTRSEESMGVLAMEMILRRQDKDFRKYECERIPAKLVLRGSEKCRTTGLIQRQPCL